MLNIGVVRAGRWVLFAALALSLLLPAGPAAADDPFQRVVTFKNELPITVYPVITAVESENGANCGTLNVLHRLIVNVGQKGAGIPTGATVQVTIPKAPSCWYKAVRLYVFSVDLAKYEQQLDPTQQTVPDNINWNPALCPNNACWTGTARAQYPVDSPAQLTEYTIDSLDPATGKPFPDPNNPNGIPLVDLDLSFVDSVYLPTAMALDDAGATEYMGTILGYDDFNNRTAAFLTLKDTKQRPVWSEFSAYSAVNWPNNVFNSLGSKRTDQVEGGFNLIENVLTNAQSALYTPTYSGPAACTNPQNQICYKQGLVGNCCPAQNGRFLTCCSAAPYLIDNTTKVDATVDNPIGNAFNQSTNALVQRWTAWIGANNPCSNIGNITPWPSTSASFNKQAFCDAFKATAQSVWNTFTPACSSKTGVAKNQCIVENIIGYASTTDKGQLPESVQALQRSVPWGDPAKGQLQYSFDKFILFWAPYSSVFNLNPYTRLVHNATDGLDAPGAYSFSIDDRFGNFQGRASGFIVDLGGKSVLPNQEAYDPYQQYDVGFAGGWDHVSVCGRPFAIPNAKPGNAPISFWLNGKPQTYCDIAFYTSSTEQQFAKYRVGELSKTVTDTYTGLKQTLTALVLDQNYCTANSTPALVAAGVCLNSNVSPNYNGDVAYVSLSDADKPAVHLNVPKNPM
jgi:hypothetical protein